MMIAVGGSVESADCSVGPSRIPPPRAQANSHFRAERNDQERIEQDDARRSGELAGASVSVCEYVAHPSVLLLLRRRRLR